MLRWVRCKRGFKDGCDQRSVLWQSRRSQESGVGGASKEVGAPENRISGRSHILTPWNKDLESSTWIETAPLTVRKYSEER
jgi:hypothetical protein